MKKLCRGTTSLSSDKIVSLHCDRLLDQRDSCGCASLYPSLPYPPLSPANNLWKLFETRSGPMEFSFFSTAQTPLNCCKSHYVLLEGYSIASRRNCCICVKSMQGKGNECCIHCIFIKRERESKPIKKNSILLYYFTQHKEMPQ